jgi:twinkle protein
MAKHRDYFRGFEKIVLMFDMDQPGRDAAKIAAEVLGSGAAIADIPLKDAAEMLLKGKTSELITAMWNAKPYRPDGIVDMATLKEAVMQRPAWGLSWPLERLTQLTYGIRAGELYAFGAGTGIGKTDLFTQTIMHLVTVHGLPVGVFSLEQSVSETATRIAGKLVGKTFHIPDSGWTDEDFERAWQQLHGGTGRVFLYDSFGNNDWETVREKMEYLAHAEGVRHFFLDHLTALAAWQDDERTALDSIMSEMGGLVKKLGCTIFFISHLATPEGKPHEEGGRVMIRHFRGSRSIGYWSHFMFGLERNQQDPDPVQRSITTFRVLKDRYTGKATGEVFYLGYDQESGMLYETQSPEEESAHGFVDETGENSGGDF